MRDVTLAFLIDTDRICLAMKKRGFGAGKLNGYGGKVSEGESIAGAAVRELLEESSVHATENELEQVATIEFSFEGKPDWSQRMHVFFIRTWEGDPIESEEMAPVWSSHGDIPYDQMWIDDEHWLPRVIAGERLTGSFHFNEDGSAILQSELRAL